MICNYCTARISDKSVVCPECGAPVKHPRSMPAQNGNYPPQRPYPSQQQPPYGGQVDPRAYSGAPRGTTTSPEYYPGYPSAATSTSAIASMTRPESPTAIPPVSPVVEEVIPENYDEAYSVWGFIGTMIVGAIPLIGFILYLVWAFSSSTNLSKRNYCRAILLMQLFSLLATVIGAAILIASGYDLASQLEPFKL